VIHPPGVFLLAALFGAAGLWLMLPRGLARGWMVGVVLASAGLGLLVSQVPGLGGWVADGLFYTLAGITIASAVATIAIHNPVYAAIWFGMTLLGTAGLFLFQGAQFLAVATIVVYAGAILVTFLFVLMLAQPQGRAVYDRVSWEALISAATGSVIIVILAVSITSVLSQPERLPMPRVTAAERRQNVLSEDHVARLGTELFGPNLIAVEAAGVLLLAALIGAAVIVVRGTPPVPESAPVAPLSKQREQSHGLPRPQGEDRVGFDTGSKQDGREPHG
jgi:NADH-quinone oxidoreductase subunit J